MNDAAYLTALKEHQTNNLDLAKKLYLDILKVKPKNPDILHLLGILFAQQQDFLSSHHFMEQALKIKPNSPTFLNSMGNVLKNLNRYEDAILQYKKALQLQPNNPVAHNNIGNVLYHLGKLQEAKEHYSEAIRLKPQYADAHCNLSLILTKQNLIQEASKHLKITLQLQPNHDLAHQYLAHLLQLQGKLDQAMDHYQMVLKANANNPLAHHNLGVILTNKGKYLEAIYHFKIVLDLQPEHIESLYNLGAIFLLQKKPDAALPYFLHLTKLVKDSTVYYNIGIIYMDLARFTEATTYFAAALKIHPNDFATHTNLGTTYLRQQNFAAAEKHYNQAQRLQPNNKEVTYILAALQQKTSLQKAPAEYIKHLFDQYAPYFEQHLKLLNYQVPQLLFNTVQTIMQSKAMDTSLRILDLGCGTGMCGTKFKPMAQELIGIDLSENMLELAQKKNIYTDLKNLPLEHAITIFSNIDIIIAAESLVYFGELKEIFTNCYNALKLGGIFAFTLENTNHYPYILQRSARFAHSKEYIVKTARNNHFTILQANKIILRKHCNTNINGYIFVLQK